MLPLFKCFVLVFALGFFVAGAAAESARDPFQSSEPLHLSNPLTAYPVSQYRVHGVVVMIDKATAVVYTPKQTWHIVRVGTALGSEQAVIRAITVEGIQIELARALHWLPVLR